MSQGMSNSGQYRSPPGGAFPSRSGQIIADPNTLKNLGAMGLAAIKQKPFPSTPGEVLAKQAGHELLNKLPGSLGGVGRPR